MPASRRVHFLDPVTNTVVSPAPLTPSVIPQSQTPPTPSPTYSGSSLPSSSPSTPSSNVFHSSSIQITGNEIRVHPTIANNISTPHSYFDVSSSPSMLTSPNLSLLGNQRVFLPSNTIHPSSSHISFDPAVLNDPATYPPLPSVTLISDLLPWAIHVEASQAFPTPVVTVYDVLQTLHITLRIPIVPCEWTCLPLSTQMLVSTAFYRRLDNIVDYNSRESQRRKGVRRMDFLAGRTRLLGLTPVVDKPGLFTVAWGECEV